jgi:ketosteroid isomerase-like protein
MHRFCWILILNCIAIAIFRIEVVRGAATGPDADAEIAAIRAAASAYTAAVRSGNVDVMRRTWTPEGDYIDASGRRFKAHELIPQQAAASPSSSSPHPATAKAQASSSTLRLITPTVAIEDGAVDAGASDDGSALTGRFTAVWVKHDGRWLLDSLRESMAATTSFNERLRPLEWLLGEWVGTTGDSAILVSSRWSDDGEFIIREFLIRSEGRADISATQRIGWDATAGTIRCWTFDSLGGSAEGIWRRDGKRWLVNSSEVLADGRKSKTSAVYVLDDEGNFASEVSSKWGAVDGNEGGPSLPKLRFEFKRAVEDE